MLLSLPNIALSLLLNKQNKVFEHCLIKQCSLQGNYRFSKYLNGHNFCTNFEKDIKTNLIEDCW